jgi:hypothetical protein
VEKSGQSQNSGTDPHFEVTSLSEHRPHQPFQ